MNAIEISEKDIRHVANLLGLGVTIEEIRELCQVDGIPEERIFLLVCAASLFLRSVEEIPQSAE